MNYTCAKCCSFKKYIYRPKVVCISIASVSTFSKNAVKCKHLYNVIELETFPLTG